MHGQVDAQLQGALQAAAFLAGEQVSATLDSCHCTALLHQPVGPPAGSRQHVSTQSLTLAKAALLCKAAMLTWWHLLSVGRLPHGSIFSFGEAHLMPSLDDHHHKNLSGFRKRR